MMALGDIQVRLCRTSEVAILKSWHLQHSSAACDLSARELTCKQCTGVGLVHPQLVCSEQQVHGCSQAGR